MSLDKFYIGQKGMRTDQDLRTDKFVFVSDKPHPPLGKRADLNGPYNSISNLKKHSPIFKSILTENPKLANKLVEPKRVKRAIKPVLIPKGMSFPIDLKTFYEHCMCGTFKDGLYTGVHFYDKEAVIIKRRYYTSFSGVMKADVLKYNYELKQWFLKTNTNLFPYFWNETVLLLKLDHAFRWKFPLTGKKGLFGALTDCGIKVVFAYMNGKPKTVYPLI